MTLIIKQDKIFEKLIICSFLLNYHSSNLNMYIFNKNFKLMKLGKFRNLINFYSQKKNSLSDMYNL